MEAMKGEEQQQERAFVESQLSQLIHKAAETFAKNNGLDACVIDEGDKKEFFEKELRIEPASEIERDVNHLVYEFQGTRKQTSTKLAKENKQTDSQCEDFVTITNENSQPEPLSENEVRFEAQIESKGDEHTPGRKAKLAYESRMVDDGKFKMLIARVDKDYKFRVYPLKGSFLQKIVQYPKFGAIGGAVAGAVVGGAIGALMPIVMAGGWLATACGAGGAAVGYNIEKLLPNSGEVKIITAEDVLSQFGNEDEGVCRVEGRCVSYKVKYNYQHLAEVMTLEELVIDD